MEITYKSNPQRPIRKPAEEQVRRDVVCPSCGLDHSVYGLATWCADCGEDIFLTHVDAELSVIRKMLDDIARRREILGERIVAKDLENCLEDTLSIFEAVLKILVRRSFLKRGKTFEEIDQLFRQTGNCFQSINRTVEFLTKYFQTQGIPGLLAQEADMLRLIFEKRHPITHNLGVIDRKYLEKVSTAEQEGREIMVTEAEISHAIGMIHRIFRELINQL